MCSICSAPHPAGISALSDNHVANGNADSQLGSLNALSRYLRVGYWVDNYETPRSFDLGLGRTLTYNVSALPGDTRYLAESALQAWADVTGIKFVKSGYSADITFDDFQPGAFAEHDTDGRVIRAAHINVEADWDYDFVSINSYWFQTYMHEIGHALGLGHAGNYNGDADYYNDHSFSNDSWQASVMSYFDQEQNPNTKADFAYAATVMPADILAIQAIYGTDFSTREGNTVYGSKTNVTGYLGDLFKMMLGEKSSLDKVFVENPVALTIFDTGGRDTLSFAPSGFRQTINLNPGAASDVLGLNGNLIIAVGTVIENAIGGRSHDRLIGNSARNQLSGRDGNDTLSGGNGDDQLNGGNGNDVMDGGTGQDTAVFNGSSNIRVDMSYKGAQSTGQGNDRFSRIENLTSGSGNDNLVGNKYDNRLIAGDGNDTLAGGKGDDILQGDRGNDWLTGGGGRDTAVFVGTKQVKVDLSISKAQQTGQGRDKLASIENITSGKGDDRLSGNKYENVLKAGSGDDRLSGEGGRDRLYGSAGSDWLDGGKGNDHLFGGKGADDFLFRAGRDVIHDFADNSDEIHLYRGALGLGNRSVAQILDAARIVDGDTVLNFGHGNKLIIEDLSQVDALANDIVLH